MPIDAETVRLRFQRELHSIADPRLLAHIESLQVAPSCEMRAWDYGRPGQRYPCWIVLRHEASDTGIAFCEHGFGPRYPWGLLSIGAEPRSMGMDSGWFSTFGEAHLDSFAATDLDIWRVVRGRWGALEWLTEEGGWDDSWRIARERGAADPANSYWVHTTLSHAQ